jgi:hypothetical protein
MYSRYSERQIFINNSKDYKDKIFTNRDVEELMQYSTARFRYPTLEEMQTFRSNALVWQSDSRLYKLANDYYGYPSLWWVIAWYNKKPTEAHFSVGDIFYVPAPLELVLDFFKRRD